jgi:hypothetical protein
MTRLDNVAIIYADPLNGVGRFAPENGIAKIGLDKSYDEATLEDAVWHELEHALEGWEPTANQEYGLTLNQRSGLLHHTAAGEGYGRWMNEVVADKMSQLLKDDTVDYATLSYQELGGENYAAPHYVDEEPLIAFLLNGPNGPVAFYDVLAAHYENYDADAPDGERSPNLKRFHDQLSNTWGGFEGIAPVIYDADREDWGGPDRDPKTLPYTKALQKLIERYLQVKRANSTEPPSQS